MFMKSSIDIIGGPAGITNKIDITATSYIAEVDLDTFTYSLAGWSSKTMLMLCGAAWLTESDAAAAIISEWARDSECEVMA